MEHLFTSRRMSSVFRPVVLVLVLILVACGSDSDDADVTIPPDSNQAAVPTVPTGDSTPDTIVSEEEITVLQSEIPATASASTPAASEVDEDEDTPSPVDLTGTDTELEEAVATPADVVVSETVEASPLVTVAEASPDADETSPAQRARTGNETFDHPGDGTGGSGMPGELDVVGDDADDAAIATPVASPIASPVALLSISGCEVPDVPGFLGENTTFMLTEDLNFRSGPGVECDPLMDEPIGEGQVVEVIGGPVTQADDDSEWVQIEIDGEPGWITTEFIEPVE